MKKDYLLLAITVLLGQQVAVAQQVSLKRIETRVADAKSNSYVNILNQRVQNAWSLPEKSPPADAEIYFEVEPSGKLRLIQVKKLSGSSSFDFSARRAIETSVPFVGSRPKDRLKIIATFDHRYSKPKTKIASERTTNLGPRQAAPYHEQALSLSELPPGIYLYREPNTGSTRAYVQSDSTTQILGNSPLPVRNLPLHLLQKVLHNVLQSDVNIAKAPSYRIPRSAYPMQFPADAPQQDQLQEPAPAGIDNDKTHREGFKEEQPDASHTTDLAESQQAWNKWHMQFADAVSQTWNDRVGESGKALVNVTVTRDRRIIASIVSSSGGFGFQQSLMSVFKDLNGNPGLTFPFRSNQQLISFQKQYIANTRVALGSNSSPQNGGVGLPFPQNAGLQKNSPQTNSINATNKACELSQIGNKALLEGNLSAAREAFESACKYDPNNNSLVVHLNLGMVCERLKDFESARKTYIDAQKFAKSKSDLGELHSRLGLVCENLDNSDEAINHLKKAINYGKEEAFLSISNVYRSSGRIPEAILFLEQYISQAHPSREIQQAEAQLKSLKNANIGVGNPSAPNYFAGESQTIKWTQARLPLKVYIDQDPNNPYYKQSYLKIVFEALDAWCDASENKIQWSRADNSDAADITVEWSSFPQGSAEAGITNCRSIGRSPLERQLDKARIKIFTLQQDGTEVPDNVVRLTCLHEVGSYSRK